LKPKPFEAERQRVRKDSRRVEAKRKIWARSERHFISGEDEKEYLIVRRFPDNARSSF
jgi:hypothetical protein